MLIVCPACQARHEMDTAQIPPQATMVRCRSCDTRFALSVPREARSVHDGLTSRARRLGVLISKGGVGKTTTAVNLAAGLASQGRRVLLVDTDTQGQAAYALGLEHGPGLAELLADEAPLEQVLAEARENLSLLRGGKALAGVKRMIDRKDFAGESTLCEALAPLDDQFDYVVVDSSPGWDPLTVNVLFYVREVLTPVSLEVMSLQGLGEFLKSLAQVGRYNKDIALRYIVPTFFDKRMRQPRAILKKLSELYPDFLCRPVRSNIRLAEAPASGQTIFEYAPESVGAADYLELVKRVDQDLVAFRAAS